MKYIKSFAILLCVMMIGGQSFAQTTQPATSTVQVRLLNNDFSHVDLVNSYGNERKVFASSDITNDQFTLNLNLANDIYRFDFGNDNFFLYVVKPGENVQLTIDAEDLQSVPSVTGSPSMAFVKEATGLTSRKKVVLDSLNAALQSDPNQKYWSNITQNVSLYSQTNDDVDRYIISSFQSADSLAMLCKQMAPSNKVKGSEMDLFLASATKLLKNVDNNYRPFASYLENVGSYYDFSTGRQPGNDNFYAKLDHYINKVNGRHQMAISSIGSYMDIVRKLIADRDSLVFNDLMGQKKVANGWAERVIALVNEHIVPMSAKANEYQQQVTADKSSGAGLVSDAQQILREVVNTYQTKYNETDSYLNGKLIDLIKGHKDDVAVLMFVDMFPREQNAALHEEVIRALHVTNPDHPIVKERWNILNSPAHKTSIGAMAPDLAFPDPDGKIRKLSDLRGKVVLLDFWASWCGPCRRESPNVRNVYAKYHDQGFEVFSVSLDRDANNWKKAIADDKLVWPNHVSDLKYWSSEAAAIYGVRSIPSMFLIDREGRIVAKDLRGAALENAVRELINK
ncbi:MAG: TlpA family protein disulfide reductase [Bacteroidales bacterium]|nr:TlpA family protein disulfide reductase [Bacteroidales bacterium]